MIRRHVTMREIVREVASVYRLAPHEISLVGVARHANGRPLRLGLAQVIEARLLCIYVGRQVTRLSLRQLAERLGYGDHTSALNAVRRIAARAAADDVLAARIPVILAALDRRSSPARPACLETRP